MTAARDWVITVRVASTIAADSPAPASAGLARSANASIGQNPIIRNPGHRVRVAHRLVQAVVEEERVRVAEREPDQEVAGQ